MLTVGCGDGSPSRGVTDTATPDTFAATDSEVPDSIAADTVTAADSEARDTVADTAAPDTAAPDTAASAPTLCQVTDVVAMSCPQNMLAGATCQTITVSGCPGFEAESVDAVIAVLPATPPLRGTVVHFAGGGGNGVEARGVEEYAAAGFRQVFVSWRSDWEQTASLGIKAAAARPATVLDWIWHAPDLHAASRALAFCGQGNSGGAGQLGYALAHYGLGDYLDYVNELSGPPFTRIDLGCDGDAPASAEVCGETVTMQLPHSLDGWENIAAPLACGSHDVPAAELARWQADSIAVGGTYDYPATEVQFYDCTFHATAVTAMAQLFAQLIATSEGGAARVGYHCYGEADGCHNEALGTGTDDAIAALIAGCVPRH